MIKKILLVLTGFVLAVAVFGVAGFAYAQTQNPPDLDDICPFCGTGDGYSGRGQGGSGMMAFSTDGEYGLMHETMIAVFAEALGLTPAELESRLDAGETMWQIATDQGLSSEEFTALMLDVRTNALDQAVADSLITQEQADWMLSRWNNMHSGSSGVGVGTGPCQGGTARGGMGGRGGGR
jgi:hypothetical protein